MQRLSSFSKICGGLQCWINIQKGPRLETSEGLYFKTIIWKGSFLSPKRKKPILSFELLVIILSTIKVPLPSEKAAVCFAALTKTSLVDNVLFCDEVSYLGHSLAVNKIFMKW